MILCAHSNKSHSSPCSVLKLFLFQSVEMGIESGLGLLFGNWNISLIFPKAWNGNENEVMGMGGNGYTKVIPAHL